MRNNPRLLFRLWLALAILGAAVAMVGLFLPRGHGSTILQRLPLFGGGLMLLGGGTMALLTWFKLSVAEKLQSGENLLGQWRIGPGDLARFREADRKRGVLAPTLANWLSFPDEVPAAGLPIRINLQGMLIGDTLHGIGTDNGAPTIGMLCAVALIDGNPAMLELTHGKTAIVDDHRYDPLFDMNDRRPFWVMRIPVPAEARGQAEQAVAALDAAIWRVNRDWARLSYAEHFHIADRDAAAQKAALVGKAAPPPMPTIPMPAEADRSPEAEAFRSIATVFGLDAAKRPSKESPAYRRAQAQFFGGLAGLGLLFGGGSYAWRGDHNFQAAVMIIGAVLFVVALGFTIRGGYHYLIKPAE